MTASKMLAAAFVIFAAGAAAPEPSVRTAHVWRAGAAPLRYTAEAGHIDIVTAGSAQVRARMFFVAYRLPATTPPRPVTFVWNGGPGAPSATLHFRSIGPTRLDNGRLVDNTQTILPVTDLVFVDAVGTGFSRVTDERFASRFYNTLGDIDAFAEFVQAWRTQFRAADTPVVLLGESFGAPRAAGVAERLLAMGIRVDAVSLVSGGLGLGRTALPDEWANALRVPEWAAIAMRHGKGLATAGTPADAVRADALAWARRTYAPALARVAHLDDAERTDVAATLARYTGLPVGSIDRASLVVTPRQFRTELLRDRGQTLALFDLRRTSPIESSPVEAAAMERQLRRDLGYATSLAYVGLDDDRRAGARSAAAPKTPPLPSVNERWDYFAPGTSEADRQAAIAEAVRVGGGPPGVSEPWIRRAFALNPRLRIHVATGRYDAGQCLQTAETVARLELPLRAAYTARCYEGGHMMYLDDEARVAFANDLTVLIGGLPR